MGHIKHFAAQRIGELSQEDLSSGGEQVDGWERDHCIFWSSKFYGRGHCVRCVDLCGGVVLRR